MERQLTLLDRERPDWKLDEHTRTVGLEGVAQAREALRLARAALRDERHERDAA